MPSAYPVVQPTGAERGTECGTAPHQPSCPTRHQPPHAGSGGGGGTHLNATEPGDAAAAPVDPAEPESAPGGACDHGPPPTRHTRPERRRLALVLLLSGLVHALLLSLTFGGQTPGLPGLGWPWQDRRIVVPDLRIVLLPAPAETVLPAAKPAAERVQPDRLEPTVAAGLALPAAAPAPLTQGGSAADVLPAAEPRTQAAPEPDTRRITALARPPLPAVSAALSSAQPPAQPLAPPLAQPPAQPPAEPAAPPVPEPTLTPLTRSGGSTWAVPVVPVAPAVPTVPAVPAVPAVPVAPKPSVMSTPVASGPEAPPLPSQAADVAALARTAQDARERAAELAERDRTRQAAQVAATAAEAARQATARQEAARAEAAQLEIERVESTRRAAARQEAARQVAAQQDAVRQDAARQDAVRQDAARRETARLQAERQTAAEQEAARQEAQRQVAERQELARVEAARLDAERVAAAQRAAALQEASRQAAALQAAAQQDAGRTEAARTEAARIDAAQATAAKREALLRAIGQQLNEEADRRDAASAAARLAAPLAPSPASARRGRLLGRSDPNAELVLYAEAWSRKIQLNRGFDLVRDLAKQPHTDPLVTVALRSDGSVESVTFVRASGVAALDDAIRRIVHSQAPYPAFPPGLARDFDVIEVRRTWYFDMAIRLY